MDHTNIFRQKYRERDRERQLLRKKAKKWNEESPCSSPSSFSNSFVLRYFLVKLWLSGSNASQERVEDEDVDPWYVNGI